MSVEAVKKFMNQAKNDPALQKQFQAIRMGAGEKTIADLIKTAKNAGYTFTAQDYDEAVNQVLEEKFASGALNDEELALVAGGLMCVSSDGTKKCTCCNPSLTLTRTTSL